MLNNKDDKTQPGHTLCFTSTSSHSQDSVFKFAVKMKSQLELKQNYTFYMNVGLYFRRLLISCIKNAFEHIQKQININNVIIYLFI